MVRCLVYLDDIISFGTTFEEALDNLTSIFERLRLVPLVALTGVATGVRNC